MSSSAKIVSSNAYSGPEMARAIWTIQSLIIEYKREVEGKSKKDRVYWRQPATAMSERMENNQSARQPQLYSCFPHSSCHHNLFHASFPRPGARRLQANLIASCPHSHSCPPFLSDFIPLLDKYSMHVMAPSLEQYCKGLRCSPRAAPYSNTLSVFDLPSTSLYSIFRF